MFSPLLIRNTGPQLYRAEERCLNVGVNMGIWQNCMCTYIGVDVEENVARKQDHLHGRKKG